MNYDLLMQLVQGVGSGGGWILAIGIAISFWQTRTKDKTEIEALKSQIVTMAGEHLLRLQSARRAYNSAQADASRFASQLFELLNSAGTVEDVNAARERFCTCFFVDVIPRFIEEAEFHFIDYESIAENQLGEDLRDRVLELQRFARWLNVVNNGNILNQLGRSPAIVSRRTFSPFFTMMAKLPGNIRDVQLQAVNDLVHQMTFGHQDE